LRLAFDMSNEINVYLQTTETHNMNAAVSLG